MSFEGFNGELDFGVENPERLKIPYLKVVKNTSGEVGQWAGQSQIRTGEFVSSTDVTKHGFAVEFFPVVGFQTDQRGRPQTGRRFVDPTDYSKTLCRSYDSVRPVADHSALGGGKPPFYDPRTGTNVIIDFAYQPHEKRHHEDGLHVGGCQTCPLGNWNEKQPPPCKPSALLPVYVARSISFDPSSGLQGDPLAFYREQQEKNSETVTNDSRLVEYFDFLDWNEFMVFVPEKFALDSVVTGVWTVAAEKPKVPNINFYLQRYIHTVPAKNATVDELLKKMSGGPEGLMVFRNAEGTLFSTAEALAYDGDDLEFYGLRAIRMYTLSTPNKNPSYPAHVTPKLTLGTYIMEKDTNEFNEYMDRRRLAMTQSVPEMLGWRTTEDFMNQYDYEELPPVSRPALPAGEEGILPPQVGNVPAQYNVGDYGLTALLDE